MLSIIIKTAVVIVVILVVVGIISRHNAMPSRVFRSRRGDPLGSFLSVLFALRTGYGKVVVLYKRVASKATVQVPSVRIAAEAIFETGRMIGGKITYALGLDLILDDPFEMQAIQGDPRAFKAAVQTEVQKMEDKAAPSGTSAPPVDLGALIVTLQLGDKIVASCSSAVSTSVEVDAMHDAKVVFPDAPTPQMASAAATPPPRRASLVPTADDPTPAPVGSLGAPAAEVVAADGKITYLRNGQTCEFGRDASCTISIPARPGNSRHHAAVTVTSGNPTLAVKSQYGVEVTAGRKTEFVPSGIAKSIPDGATVTFPDGTEFLVRAGTGR